MYITVMTNLSYKSEASREQTYCI